MEENPKPTFFRNMLFVGLVIGVLWSLKNVFNVEAREETSPFEVYAEELLHEKEDHEHETHDKKQASHKKETPLNEKNASNETEEFKQEGQEKNVESNEKRSTGDRNYFNNLLNQYKQEYFREIPAGRNRTDIVVRYYYHEPDNDKVQKLKDLKLYLHIRPVSETRRDHQSNSLYYGDSVSTRDIQLIAYTLISNGVPIKQLVPSKYHDNWKARAVEIGSDTDLADAPILTLEQIQSFSNDLLQN